jgi:hypothetical protein
LAQGNVARFDDVTRLNVHKCLMFLAFEKEKNDLEYKMINKK